MPSITSLLTATALSGTEPLPVDQSGATVKATVNQVKTYVNTTPAITGGSINSTPIGATTPSTGAFTSLSASGAGTASTVPLLIQSPTSDATIRFKTTSGTAGINQFEIRSVGVAGYDGLQFRYVNDANTLFTQMALISPAGLAVTGNISSSGTITPQQATTAGAPAYDKGAIYFDTTLNKLRVGGATAWETITSI